MASPVHAALCALVACAFCSLLGYAVARHLLPRALALATAPVMGWAIQSAVTLPLFELVGFSATAVTIAAILCAAAGGVSLVAIAPTADGEPEAATVPAWAYAAAALLALVPTVAIVPKVSAVGAHVANPIFDHAKIAIVDAMTRQGLPPIDPVFGSAASAGRLVYYYLWHYSAAELALPLSVSGWEAEIGLTWFTAFASLSLMMGLAVWLGKRSSAAIWTVAFAGATSLRRVLSWLTGSYTLAPFMAGSTGFAGWLFQSAWAPQHVMSASCVVTAILLVARYAERQSLAVVPVLGLMVAAAFESSTYVGGIIFALAALAAAPVLVVRIAPGRRVGWIAGLAGAAVVALCLASPFVRDQFAMVAAREAATPITIRPFEVLGDWLPPTLRRLLDVPAYWLILLPVEFPVACVAGAIGLIAVLRGAVSGLERFAVPALACLAAVGLTGSWLLTSRIGFNNDLGLRAILPALSVLIAAAAAGIQFKPRRALVAATAIAGLILTTPDTVGMIRSNVEGTPVPDGNLFAQAPELWRAVRRYAAPDARVANDPLYLQDLTPWPVNLSWALLANRSSCFAGQELALTFAPLPVERREAIAAQFVRIFAGQGTPQDIGEMAETYGCDVVVLVPQDAAWNNDPFAASTDYRLAEERQNRWRIYVRR